MAQLPFAAYFTMDTILAFSEINRGGRKVWNANGRTAMHHIESSKNAG